MKPRGSHESFSVARVATTLLLLLGLAACGTGTEPEGIGAPALAPQASGSFSGGSLLRGSVISEMSGSGIGNAEKSEYLLRMTVDGEQWFECRNPGGNLAPGQLTFTDRIAEEGIAPEDVDTNGRFVKSLVEEGPTAENEDCKGDWTVNTVTDEEGESSVLTFLQVASVRVDLFQEAADGSESLADTFTWTCEDPDPTSSLASYEAPPLTDVCTTSDDGGGNGNGKGKGKKS